MAWLGGSWVNPEPFTLGRVWSKGMGNTPNIKQFVEALLEQLKATYPVFAENKPLRIGMQEDLIAAFGATKPFEIRIVKKAIGKHCQSEAYQQALAAGGDRYNLIGEPDGDINPIAIEAAKERLEQRFGPAKAAELEAKKLRAEVELKKQLKAQRKRERREERKRLEQSTQSS